MLFQQPEVDALGQPMADDLEFELPALLLA